MLFRKLFRLALIYCESGINPGEALKLAKKAAELKPNYESYYVLARAYLSNNNPQKAVEYFKESLKLNPNNTWCLYWLGKVYKYYLKNTDEAEKYFERTLEINPNFRFILEELQK
ncbi:MAG: tetratricopeptide repeat protein [Elusimicrobiales bacterium]